MAGASRAKTQHSDRPSIEEPTQQSRVESLWSTKLRADELDAKMAASLKKELDAVEAAKQILKSAQGILATRAADHPLMAEYRSLRNQEEVLKAQLLDNFQPGTDEKTLRTTQGHQVQFRSKDSYSVDDPRKLMEALLKDETLYDGCRPAIQIETDFAVPIAQRNLLPGVVAETKVSVAMVASKGK